MKTNEKMRELRSILQSMQSAAVAFSGGVDSTFLLKVAKETLGKQIISVIVRSGMFVSTEYEEAVLLADALNIKRITVDFNVLFLPEIRQNQPDRCYHCKKAIFTKIIEVARDQGMACVVDGTHADDLDDYRPGVRALQELGVRSPLKEVGLTKSEIRRLSEEYGLSTANKPSMACLASRFPYGIAITSQNLKQIAAAEAFLRDLGFNQLRVRHHDTLVRIEVLPGSIQAFMDSDNRNRIVGFFKKMGYHYITLDLEGYRTGSMNEVLGK
ncbi:ATP-dependent sacrificial sulfur transferase LarE [bacterium]|nr:ATP-dependent sacrificial sulfur transferase LarE [bacterium]